MRRLALAACLTSALGLSACTSTSSSTSAKAPSAPVRRLLRAGPAAACSSSATAAQRKSFARDHAELSDEQLAWVCPDLYPKGFLTARERAKLKLGKGITSADAKGANR